MIDSPDDDKPGFAADKPEQCCTCFRLIRTGQTYSLALEDGVLCAASALVEEILRVREDLAVEVKHNRLLVGQ